MYEKKRKKRRDGKAGKRSTETETVSLKENSGEKKPRGGRSEPGAYSARTSGRTEKRSAAASAVYADAAYAAVDVQSAASEQKNQNEPAVGIVAIVVVSASTSAAAGEEKQNPDNTAAIVSEQVVVGNTASIIAATAVVTSASTVCSS